MFAWLKNIFGLIFLIIAVIFIRLYVATPIGVQGESMMPTLVDGERAILYKLGDIHRFDIVPLIATDDPSLNYVKRVIGLPGESIEYKDDVLYINGVATNEPFLDAYKKKWHDAGNNSPFTADFSLNELTGQMTVPKNHYFVLGDNRQVSKDSRFSEVGFIPKENVLGKLKLVIWPMNQFEVFN